MRFKQNRRINAYLYALTITILFCGIIQTAPLSVAAQSGLIVEVSSNTTWTKADSPHNLTGPLLVNQGVILSIEAGATVNLNGYEMRVNGTLVARGTITDQIRFINGTINFTEFSAAWDSKTSSGSILQYSFFVNVKLIESVSVNINSNLPIRNDVVWTKENSPYTLVGELIIDSGATLSVEAGTTVNLNQYLLRIGGCLIVVGSNDEPIYFNKGSITFEDYSKGWNEGTVSGSRIEHAVLSDVNLNSYAPLRIAGCNVTGGNVQGNSLTLLENHIGCKTSVAGESVIKNNDLGSVFLNAGSITVSNNKIGNMDCSGGSPVITNNTIYGLGSLELTKENTTTNFFVADSPVITNNEVTGGIYLECNSATVTNNIIYPRKYTVSWSWWERLYLFYTDSRSETTVGVFIQGNADVFGNTIFGSSVGIEGLDNVQGNTFCECSIGIQGASTIKNNLFIDNYVGIKPNVQTLIQTNTFVNNSVAIDGRNCPSISIKDNLFINNREGIVASDNVIIERNQMEKNSYAIKLDSGVNARIQNNSFSENVQAIKIEGNPSSANIIYNNFNNNLNNSIRLESVTTSIDATNNWWGTTDNQAIGVKIYDSKYSFDLATVTFSPFLTEPNPQTTPTTNPPEPFLSYNQIPEFPAWTLLPFALIGTFVVVLYKRKIHKLTSKGSHVCAAY